MRKFYYLPKAASIGNRQLFTKREMIITHVNLGLHFLRHDASLKIIVTNVTVFLLMCRQGDTALVR